MTFPALQTISITDQQIRLVRKSWRLLRDIHPQVVGDLFYTKLFLDHPELRSMFPKDLTLQHHQLVELIGKVVARLDRLDNLVMDIREMGLRHETYRVTPRHYDWVGNALLWTLKNGMNTEWTPELETAWTECYKSLVAIMLDA